MQILEWGELNNMFWTGSDHADFRVGWTEQYVVFIKINDEVLWIIKLFSDYY